MKLQIIQQWTDSTKYWSLILIYSKTVSGHPTELESFRFEDEDDI